MIDIEILHGVFKERGFELSDDIIKSIHDDIESSGSMSEGEIIGYLLEDDITKVNDISNIVEISNFIHEQVTEYRSIYGDRHKGNIYTTTVTGKKQYEYDRELSMKDDTINTLNNHIQDLNDTIEDLKYKLRNLTN